jgi:hypothetical protein
MAGTDVFYGVEVGISCCAPKANSQGSPTTCYTLNCILEGIIILLHMTGSQGIQQFTRQPRGLLLMGFSNRDTYRVSLRFIRPAGISVSVVTACWVAPRQTRLSVRLAQVWSSEFPVQPWKGRYFVAVMGGSAGNKAVPLAGFPTFECATRTAMPSIEGVLRVKDDKTRTSGRKGLVSRR